MVGTRRRPTTYRFTCDRFFTFHHNFGFRLKIKSSPPRDVAFLPEYHGFRRFLLGVDSGFPSLYWRLIAFY